MFPYAENIGLRCSIYDGTVNNSGWSSWDIRYRLYPLRYSDLFGVLMRKVICYRCLHVYDHGIAKKTKTKRLRVKEAECPKCKCKVTLG